MADKQHWFALGVHGKVTPDQARRLAKKRVGEIADDRNPAAERESARTKEQNTVDALLDTYFERHLRRNLRSPEQVERALNRHVRPRIGRKPVDTIKRRDVVEMLDAIEDESGPVMGDRILAYLRKAFNWWAMRDESFVPPIIRGMERVKGSERARRRILEDDEIRDVWAALDKAKVPEPFPRLLRTLLLCGQRRDEVSRMRWEEIDGTVWVIPAERRKSGEANAVPLTNAVRQLLGEPRSTGFVFSTDGGKRPFSGFSKAKKALDGTIAELRVGRKRMPAWVMEDPRDR